MRKFLLRCALALVFTSNMLFGVLSCQRRPLEEPDYNTRIQVKVNVANLSNVTCDVYNPDIPVPELNPEVLRVLFYNTEGDKLLADSFISSNSVDEEGNKIISGNLSIVPGDYKIIIYQFGEEHTLFENFNSFSSLRAYTDPLSEKEVKNLNIKSLSTKCEEVLRYQPDYCVALSLEQENIPYHHGIYTIEGEASSLVESYYLQVGVSSSDYITSANAVLTDMSAAKNVSTFGMETEDPCAIHIPLIKSTDKGKSVVCNVFNTYGRVPDAENNLTVSIDIVTGDGTRVQKEYALKELFDTEDAVKHHWLIIEDIIDIPKPITPDIGGGGFRPEVENWQEENYVVQM